MSAPVFTSSMKDLKKTKPFRTQGRMVVMRKQGWVFPVQVNAIDSIATEGTLSSPPAPNPDSLTSQS